MPWATQSHLLIPAKILINITLTLGSPDISLNALTNFLLTVHEDKNILDVLQLLVSLATENPTGVAGSLSDKRGIACVFKLLNSPLEEVRINSIKLMTLILQNTKPNKKKELMDESGLWALLTDRIRWVSFASHL